MTKYTRIRVFDFTKDTYVAPRGSVEAVMAALLEEIQDEAQDPDWLETFWERRAEAAIEAAEPFFRKKFAQKIDACADQAEIDPVWSDEYAEGYLDGMTYASQTVAGCQL